jgi:hypothetical protein
MIFLVYPLGEAFFTSPNVRRVRVKNTHASELLRSFLNTSG